MNDAHPSANEVLDLTTRLAQLLLAGGFEGTLGLDRCLCGVAAAYGYRADVSVIAESAFIEIDGATRVVTNTPDIPQLDQVSAFKPWLTEVLAGELSFTRARHRLEDIAAMPQPYKPWARVAGVVLFSVGFGISIQPTWQEIWVTGLLGILVGLIKVGTERNDRAAWLAPLASSTLVAVVVLAAAERGWVHGGTVELMIPVLFVFIPGDSITMSVIEIAVGRLTAGAARLVQAMATLGALAFGPLLAAALLRVDRGEIYDSVVAPTLGPWSGWIGWSIFTVGVLLVFGMKRSDFPWVLGMVLGTYAVQLVAVRLFSDVAGTFVAAALMAAACLILGHRPSLPPAYVLYLAPFFVLTPGAHGLRGLEVLAGGTVQGVEDVGGMFILIVAIALGMLTAFTLLPATITERYGRPDPAPLLRRR
ncbi:threonine/serine ThrE exporter family protein [Nocardia huaxiensis]|uniref:threonine/serine ThrE exporter family protein n=1 Tax=Nocardia huaxiensis TaxID=2755382 RepID=UPI001E435265|nr:threonine/serine exporter family protein [Nocardia huaxiensis]UFS95939.1 threonine/serine exporter family protein [Nocardia huaxiensis]